MNIIAHYAKFVDLTFRAVTFAGTHKMVPLQAFNADSLYGRINVQLSLTEILKPTPDGTACSAF